MTYPRSYPESDAGRLELLEQLYRWKCRAKPEELVALEFGPLVRVQVDHNPPADVYVPTEADFEYCQPPCRHFTWPPARLRHTLDLTGVRNLERIKTETIGCAQFYKGEMSTIAGSAVPVVVKIYQGSLHLLTGRLKGKMNLKRFRDHWDRTLLPYIQEYRAYNSMKAIQGISVPIAYGFFEVVLPWQEPAIAMILEFVPTNTIPQLPGPIGHQKHFDDLALGMFAAVHAVTLCGVVYEYDPHPRNMIWTRGNEVTFAGDEINPGPLTVPFPVLLDFAEVDFFEDNTELCYVLQNNLLGLIEYGVYEDVLNDWWQRTLKRRTFIARAFDLSPGGLEQFGLHPTAECRPFRDILVRGTEFPSPSS